MVKRREIRNSWCEAKVCGILGTVLYCILEKRIKLRVRERERERNRVSGVMSTPPIQDLRGFGPSSSSLLAIFGGGFFG